jgi:hypothetical protein
VRGYTKETLDKLEFGELPNVTKMDVHQVAGNPVTRFSVGRICTTCRIGNTDAYDQCRDIVAKVAYLYNEKPIEEATQ